jgi:hypothetical protein
MEDEPAANSGDEDDDDDDEEVEPEGGSRRLTSGLPRVILSDAKDPLSLRTRASLLQPADQQERRSSLRSG